MDSDARFRIVAAGRRFGKTRMARAELFEAAFSMPGGKSWFVAPTDTDAEELGFEPFRETVPGHLVADGGISKSPPRSVTLTNGHRVSFRSAQSQTRGRGLDFVALDEASEHESDVWNADLRPSLLNTGGRALIIGTPKGKNWFHSEHLKGDDPDEPRYASFAGTSYDNPHIPDEEIDAERRTTPERVFRQEYLAEFIDDEGTVFPDPETVARPYRIADVDGTPPYATGIDLARTQNYLAACTLDADGMLVGFMRRRGGSWAAAGEAMERYLSSYPGVAYLDASRDNKVIEDLTRAVAPGVAVEPFSFTAAKKAEIVENLAARLEIDDVILPDPDLAGNDDVAALFAELRAFGYETTAAGNIRYGAPEGHHDDTVDALALAANEAAQQQSVW